MAKKTPLFLACSDLHLSVTPPPVRAEEPDWFEAQGKVLDQISKVAHESGVNDVLFAGDWFDKAKVSPALECWTIQKVKELGLDWYVVAGQHDLPGHRVDYLNESSLGVVLAACYDTGQSGSGTMRFLTQLGMFLGHYGYVVGLSWESGLLGTSVPIEILVLHKLLWQKDSPFPGAPESGNVESFLKQFNGTPPPLIIAGDNHVPFIYTHDKGTVVNCGALMRRKSDQHRHKPQVYVVYSDLSVTPVRLSTATEHFVIPDNRKQASALDETQLQEFIGLLAKSAGDNVLSFAHALQEVYTTRHVSEETKEYIKEKLAEVTG